MFLGDAARSFHGAGPPRCSKPATKVIDLSGAFRLGTAENYQRWYKEPHTQPDLLAEAVYGLPEFCRARVSRAPA